MPFVNEIVGVCEVCGRPRRRYGSYGAYDDLACLAKAKGGVVYYVHDSYGCDTGCCGHRTYFETPDGESHTIGDFDFMHDEEALKQFAGEQAQRLGVTVAWDRCEFYED